MIDKESGFEDTYNLVKDEESGVELSAVMLKVFVEKGYFGENRFYVI